MNKHQQCDIRTSVQPIMQKICSSMCIPFLQIELPTTLLSFYWLLGDLVNCVSRSNL
ncbi:hypothetical protein JHK82_035386 [Glycine max]|nr:hypothetical protein JHK82_035386 [Glycine max]KAG5129401.1 hypothetical protein JHK84_035798 [Glycine max]